MNIFSSSSALPQQRNEKSERSATERSGEKELEREAESPVRGQNRVARPVCVLYPVHACALLSHRSADNERYGLYIFFVLIRSVDRNDVDNHIMHMSVRNKL